MKPKRIRPSRDYGPLLIRQQRLSLSEVDCVEPFRNPLHYILQLLPRRLIGLELHQVGGGAQRHGLRICQRCPVTSTVSLP